MQLAPDGRPCCLGRLKRGDAQLDAARLVVLHLVQVLLHHEPPRFIPDRPVWMRRQCESISEDLFGRRVIVLLHEEVTVEIICVQALGRVSHGLLKQLFRLLFIAESDRPGGYPIIKHAEACRSAGIEREGSNLLDLFKDATRLFGKPNALNGPCSPAIDACSLMMMPSQIWASRLSYCCAIWAARSASAAICFS